MVTNVLTLDDRQLGAATAPRSDVVFLDLRDSLEVNQEKLEERLGCPSSPVCEGGLDHVLGVVRSPRVLGQLIARPGASTSAALVRARPCSCRKR